MEETLVPIFGMLTSFGSIFGVCYLFFMTRHKERLALIEKGADASIFKTESNSRFVLKLGMLGVGVALGIIFGVIFHNSGLMNEDYSIPAFIFLFGGLGLIMSYFIERKLNNKN